MRAVPVPHICMGVLNHLETGTLSYWRQFHYRCYSSTLLLYIELISFAHNCKRVGDGGGRRGIHTEEGGTKGIRRGGVREGVCHARVLPVMSCTGEEGIMARTLLLGPHHRQPLVRLPALWGTLGW